MINKFAVAISMLLAVSVSGQFSGKLGLYDSIPVWDQGGDTLLGAWSGGMNSPQFSTIDLDGDGKLDLFSFDRDGAVVRTFLNEGQTGEVKYRSAPEYKKYFPSGLSGWALLRDFNKDGKPDIFTSHPFGMSIYRNVSDTNGLAFEMICDFPDFFGNPVCYVTMVFGPPHNEIRSNVYNLNSDIPAIDDIDGDGDLDIMAFGVSGGQVAYYENETANIDSLDYRMVTQCWGVFAEDNLTNDVALNQFCADSGGIATVGEWLQDGLIKRGASRHAGSSLLTFDEDNDGDRELVLGDVSFDNFVLVHNGGDTAKAIATSSTPDYPTNTTPVDIVTFPAGYYFDADNDGEKDMIVAPNEVFVSENYDCVWRYMNNGTTDNPDFEYVENNFLQGEMIDFGTMAYPVFVDVDGDSLLDIIAGNGHYFDPATKKQSGALAYLKNTGVYTDTTAFPSFQLVDTDYLGLKDTSVQHLKPAFGDMDADGDMDMLLGRADGSISYFQNQALSPQDSMVLVEVSVGWTQFLDVVGNNAPSIYDLDGDGDLDVVCGETYGTLTYFENQGDSTTPDFTPSSKNLDLGLVYQADIFGNGYTNPFFVRLDTNLRMDDPDTLAEQTYLFLTSITGKIHIYGNIDGNLTGAFQLVDSVNLRVGTLSASGADMTRDGALDIIYGEQGGGMGTLLNGRGFKLPKPIAIEEKKTSLEVNLYPNPSNEKLSMTMDGGALIGYQVYDVSGRRIAKSENILNRNIFIIATNLWPEGLYNIVLETDQGTALEKFVVTH